MKTGMAQVPEEKRRKLSLALVAGITGIALLVLAMGLLWPFLPSAVGLLVVVWWFVAIAIAFLVVVAAVVLVGAGFANAVLRRGATEPSGTAEEPAEGVTARPGLLTAYDIQGADLLKHLSLQQLAQVAAISRRIYFLQGTLLARQGDKGDAVYIVLEGRVQLTSTSGLGDITVRVAGSGESLPLAALVGSRELISTARAMTRVGAAEIPCAALSELCRREPEIGVTVYQSVADILATRYRSALSRLTGTLDQALRKGDVFANM